jgi:hypothetical protein
MNRPEVKENLRVLLTGKTEVERYGAERAEEIRQKKSKARKGKFTGKDSSGYRVITNIKLISPDGVVFDTVEGIQDFAAKFDLSPHHLGEVISGKRKTHKGWSLL